MNTWCWWAFLYVVIGVLTYLAGSFMGASFNIADWHAEGRVFLVLLWFIGSGVLSSRLEDAGRI